MMLLDNKKVARLALLSAFLLSAHTAFAEDDKALHFGVSAICGAGVETCFHYQTKLGFAARTSLGTILGSVPGLAKEIIDSNQEGNSFSESDMTADIAGAFVGTIVSSVFNDTIQVIVAAGREKRIHLVVTYRF